MQGSKVCMEKYIVLHAATTESIWLKFRMDIDCILDLQIGYTFFPGKSLIPAGFKKYTRAEPRTFVLTQKEEILYLI